MIDVKLHDDSHNLIRVQDGYKKIHILVADRESQDAAGVSLDIRSAEILISAIRQAIDKAKLDI